MGISFFKKVLGDERGVTAIEYAAIAGIVSIAGIGMMPNIGASISYGLSRAEAGFDGHTDVPVPAAPEKNKGTPA